MLAAAVVLGGCSNDHAGHLDGVAYPQRTTMPGLVFPSTQGGNFDLRSACRHRECVLAFVALDDARARTFLHRLARAADGLRPRPVLVAATIDPGHDTLSRMRTALRGTGIVGVRGTYPATEVVARSLVVDVEPVSAGPVPSGEPQAVLFRPDGIAAAGWPLSQKSADLHNDLTVASSG